MDLEQKIRAFVQLSAELSDLNTEEWQATFSLAKAKNGWFERVFIAQAIQAIRQMLDEKKLRNWLEKYQISAIPTSQALKIGVVMAGNIPLVGFHDFLCVLVSGHQLYAKLSSQDEVLMKKIAQKLIQIDHSFERQITFVEKINEADAYIATGSNNAARYFHYYFAHKPHIIRKNRNSIAILFGNETTEDLKALGIDIFQYFGLGCRNVSKLYVPENYDFTPFFEAIFEWKSVLENHKYVNNYDYTKAIFLMNQIPFWDNGFVMLNENESIASPVATVYFEKYQNLHHLEQLLENQEDKIQIITSKKESFAGSIPFGRAQSPELWDYADGIDVMDFLLCLSTTQNQIDLSKNQDFV